MFIELFGWTPLICMGALLLMVALSAVMGWS